MNENMVCSLCGCETDSNYRVVEGRILCQNCCDDETFVCDSCENRFLSENMHGDNYTHLCSHCQDEYYEHCDDCGCLITGDEVYWLNDRPYCRDCYDEREDDGEYINDYYYKPRAKFHKCENEDFVRYYGVELEIDKGGKRDDYAREIYEVANKCDDVLYIKSDSSLNDGLELVSHPCSAEYHKSQFPWAEIVKTAVRLGYRSHNTCTCGLHIHIGRAELGAGEIEQEEVISRIMFFFEAHWNELFRFSRRSETTLGRWAARYGYKDKPKEILENAKKNDKGRYTCVNISNKNTVEIRMFRGTLKLNTFLATIELVDCICAAAVKLTDDEMHKQSWNDFVMSIDSNCVELIKYLKEKRLYVNEPVEDEEEM